MEQIHPSPSSTSPDARIQGESKPGRPDPNNQKVVNTIDIENIISTLPQHEGWFGSLPLYQYQGFWYLSFFLQSVITLAQDDFFEFHPSDIIICSCMKTGTTWLKSLVFSIATRTRYALVDDDYTSDNNPLTKNQSTTTSSRNPLLKWVPHDLIPFLEIDIAQDQKQRDPDLPIFSTHIPYTSLPNSITSLGCKIIYIWRDPKDTFISYWLFGNNIISKCPDENDAVSLDKAFDLFTRGVSLYGPYWDHVLGYWKASQDNPDKVLLMKYEDMMEDNVTFSYVKKIADFMGSSFSKEEVRQGVVEKIGKFCSFENLSQLEVNKSGKHRPEGNYAVGNSSYFRKGKIGDWKNYLTTEMAQKFDAITREKFRNTSLIY